jgi:predicted Zn-dependent protease
MNPPSTDTLVEPSHFDDLADALTDPRRDALPGVDRVALSLQSECSDFIRFNHGRVRQATTVRQGTATRSLVAGRRRIVGSVVLTGDLDADIALLRDERAVLASSLPMVADDPYLLLCEPDRHSRREAAGRLPVARDVIDAVTEAARGHDLVGFHAGGPMASAYADSTGSRHWHRADSFHMDWCLYAPTSAGPDLRDKAVKSVYAGSDWQADELMQRIGTSAERLPLLLKPARTLAPGAYRTAFSPAAVAELLGVLAWNGFSLRERHTGMSCLARWAAGEFGPLAAEVTWRNACAESGAPGFSDDGFEKPADVPLVTTGQPGATLNGPRSAQEHRLVANVGSDDEMPDALAMSAGRLPAADLLKALGSGLFVSNLWYLNFSEQATARATGMTRFACFWVEDGQPVSPVGVMRFDDSLIRMFGTGLVGLTDRVERHPNSDTYGRRRWESISCPAALVTEFRLTL